MRTRLSSRLLAWIVPLSAETGAFARSLLLAHLIGAEELGRAMLLALTLRLVEMASDIGIERLLIPSPRGEDPDFQAALHGAVILRGLAMARLMAALALPMALAFADGPTAWAYLSLALVPLMRAFLHLDYRRAERRRDYRAFAIVELGGTLAMLAGALAGALILGTHWAMAAALVAQGLALLCLSRVVARRRYEISLDRTVLTECWGFGAPLLLNAGLMFLTFQADRLIAAAGYGWAEVALYAVALQLALLPAQIVSRAANSPLAPVFADAIAAGGLAAAARNAVRAHAALAALFAWGFALTAPGAIALIYGAEFRPDALLAAGLAGAAAFRILRAPYSQLAVATGRTGDPARANLWRAAAILPAVALAAAGLALAGLALAAAAGEAAATMRAHLLARDILRRPLTEECPQ